MTYATFKKANSIVESCFPSNGVEISLVSLNRPSKVEITYPTGAKEVCNTCDVIFHVSIYTFYIKNPSVLQSHWASIATEISTLAQNQLLTIIEYPRSV